MAASDIGYISLLLAFAIALYTAAASVAGARWRLGELLASARNGVWAVAGLLVVAAGVLAYGFLSRDFGLRYVVLHSSLDMPWYYTASAFWGGQEGSLLYWTTVLGLFSALVVWMHRGRYAQLMPYVVAVLAGVLSFFLFVLAFFTNPFERLPFAMPDGRGLNPLLQDPGMIIHPPMLLLGYMSWTVPFAFAMAALITGRLGTEWIRAIRRWTLAAWAIQSTGLLLGAWWAYHVLGWGGYWGWDPVENVAFLPWVTGTAFLHSVLVVERRGKLKVWSLALIIASFLFAIFGTFVVRSGVLSSVHSFAESEIGPLFLGFFGLALLGSVGLLIYRLPSIRDEEGFDSLISRESGFLLNNLILIGVAFATFWGTLYPLISEAVTNTKLTVGPPFYQQVNGPLFLALLLLMGVGPLLAWRQTSRTALWRNFRWPLALGATAFLAAFLGLGRPWVALSLAATAFVLGTIAMDYWRGLRTRRKNTGESYPSALAGLVSRDRARYGGYVVHLGIVILAVGIIGSHAFQTHREVSLARGESVTVGGYTLTYQESFVRQEPGREVMGSVLAVRRGDQEAGVVVPRTEFHRNFQDQPSSKIAISSTFVDDLYVFQASVPQGGRVTLSIFVNPLMLWVWVGGTTLLLGVLIAAWPAAQRAWAPVPRVPEGAVAREV